MTRPLIIFSSLIISAQVFALGGDDLTDSEKESCESFLCLTSDSGHSTEECVEPLNNYYDIKVEDEEGNTDAPATVAERSDYLEECPLEDGEGEQELSALIPALAANTSDLQAGGASASGASEGPLPAAGADEFTGGGDLASTGTVFKPIAHGGGPLVILTPANYARHNLALYDSNGNLIERGVYSGRTNGNRATYRFRRQGGQYPAPLTLVIGTAEFLIVNPAQRIN